MQVRHRLLLWIIPFGFLQPDLCPAQTVFRSIDWAGDDICLDAAHLQDGRVAVLLDSKDSTGISDACVAFFDTSANYLDKVCLKVPGAQTARAIRATSDSGFVIAGKTAANGGDIFVAKFTKTQSLLWSGTFGGSGDEEAQSIEITDNGDILIAAYTRSIGPAGFNSLILKYNAAGTLLWSKVFHTNTFDAAYRILSIGNHYYLSCNMNISPTFGNGDQHLIKLDSSGQVIWVKAYGTSGNEHAWNMIRTLDGHIAIPFASTYGGSHKNAVLLKIDTSGAILFASRIEAGTSALDLFDLVQDPDSSYCLTGHYFTTGSLVHAVTCRLDKNGEPIKAMRSDYTLSHEFWRILSPRPYRYLFLGYGDKQGSAGSKLILGLSDSSIRLSCKNWIPLDINPGNSNFGVQQTYLFTETTGGTAQSQTWIAGMDARAFQISELNQNTGLVSLLPAFRELCEVDQLTLDPGNFQLYVWDDGSRQRIRTVDSFGNYGVRIETGACFNTDSVLVRPGNPVPFYLASDTCGRDSIELRIQPVFGHSYSWDLAPGQHQTRAKQSGWYRVEVYEVNRNCRQRDSIYVYLGGNPHLLETDSLQSCLTGNILRLRPEYHFVLSGDQAVRNEWYLNGLLADSAEVPEFQFSMYGWKDLMLRTLSRKGCIDTLTRQVYINPMPEARFLLSDTAICFTGLPVQLINVSTAIEGAIELQWHADSFPELQDQPDYILEPPRAGDYEIQLRTLSDSGCSDTFTSTLSVFPSPKADITPGTEPAQCLNGNDFLFNNTSTWLGGNGSASASWSLDSEDPMLQSESWASVQFMDSGEYLIQLKLVSDQGCSDSVSFKAKVLKNPEAGLWLSDTVICAAYDELELRDSSRSVGSHFSILELAQGWIESPFSTVRKSGFDTGFHTLKLSVLASNGCRDSMVRTFFVEKRPDFQLTTNPDSACLGNPFEAVLTGTVSAADLYFGDGSHLTTLPYRHSYQSPGTYSVMAIGRNQFGCRDTQYHEVIVHPRPLAAFETSPVCLGDTTFFRSQSQVSKGEIVAWYWDFGDGNADTGRTTQCLYGSEGNYTVRLVAVSDRECADTLEIPYAAVVRNRIPAFFSIDTLSVGYDADLFRFTGSHADATSSEWIFSTGGTYSGTWVDYQVRDSQQLYVTYRVVDEYGCVSEITDTLLFDFNRLVAIPNAFTPNRDELNPVFKPVGVKYNTSYEMLILNRWGQVIFSSQDPEQGWDGSFEGKPCMEGIYVYQIMIDRGKYQFYGTVQLIR